MIRVWDLVNDVELANLTAGVAGIVYDQDILVLDDGSLIVSAKRTSDGYSLAYHYSSTGTLLLIYVVSANNALDGSPIAFYNGPVHAITDGSFWVWLMTNSANSQLFVEIRVSDGVHLHDTFSPVFYIENLDETDSFDDPARFGSYISCTLVITRSPITTTPVVRTPIDTIGPTDSIPPDSTNSCECVTAPTNPPPGTTLPPPITNPPPLEPFIGEQIYCLGGGLVPIQADFIASEQWWGM